MGSTILLFAAAVPFFVWPVEFLLPYPFVIEELAKTVLVFFILDLSGKAVKIKVAVASGAIFAFSESVFYLFNILLLGNLETFLLRLFLTTSLHVITFLIILLAGLRKKPLMLTGTLVAILLHYFYNQLVSSIKF